MPDEKKEKELMLEIALTVADIFDEVCSLRHGAGVLETRASSKIRSLVKTIKDEKQNA